MALDVWQLLLLFAVGCIAGFMNVVAGGGSLLTMPVMVFMGGKKLRLLMRLSLHARQMIFPRGL